MGERPLTYITFSLERLTCRTSIPKIEGMLIKESGVREVSVNYKDSKVEVTLAKDSDTRIERVREVLTQLGYVIVSEDVIG